MMMHIISGCTFGGLQRRYAPRNDEVLFYVHRNAAQDINATLFTCA